MDVFSWEQRKFSDFTFPAGERNKDDLDLEPYAITNNQGFIAQSEAHDDFGYMKDVDRKMYIVVKPNSFAYNPARINVGSLGYYEGAENVIVSSLYEVFQTAEYVDDKFLKHWFKTKAFQDWIERLQEGSVRLYFYYDKLCECVMSMPSVEEQRKIGAYLDKLDNLITLHQRKCDALQKFKKSMLQKMFPQNGESVPEIRFAGFTDAWEQRKCSDFIKLVGGATPSKANKDYWDGDIVWLSSQEIKGGFVSKGTYNITQKAVDDNTTKMIPANTPMFISRSGILANSFPITRALCNVAINQDIKALLFDHTVFSNDYIVHYLESKEQFILKSIVKSGTTVQSISIPDFEKMPINIPASKDEQDRIGIYFENLDTLITLHQRKLETLQKMKKSLLQKMFV